MAATLSKMVAGSGQWAAAAGRQVGLWSHQGVTDTRRELESVGRQGSTNNYAREVIEWDRATNTYAVLGLASDVRADDTSQERRDRQEEDLHDLLRELGEGPWSKSDAHAAGKSLGWGQKKADALVKLALEDGHVTREIAAHGRHRYTALPA
jgi:hypothetical protein